VDTHTPQKLTQLSTFHHADPPLSFANTHTHTHTHTQIDTDINTMKALLIARAENHWPVISEIISVEMSLLGVHRAFRRLDSTQCFWNCSRQSVLYPDKNIS